MAPGQAQPLAFVPATAAPQHRKTREEMTPLNLARREEVQRGLKQLFPQAWKEKLPELKSAQQLPELPAAQQGRWKAPGFSAKFPDRPY